MGAFIEVVLGGLMAGVLYSLVALGFVLIYKASGVFNFAQGAMVLFAALAFARFSEIPEEIKSSAPLTIQGKAQVGVSGLAKVQYWLRPANEPWPADDPYFTKAPWQDARILPFDSAALAAFDQKKLHPAQFDPATRQPREWPMRNTLSHWTTEPRKLMPGTYEIRCRTIDLAGAAQPMPRPFPKSGKNDIQRVSLVCQAD